MSIRLKLGEMEFDGLTIEEAKELAASLRGKSEKTAEKPAASPVSTKRVKSKKYGARTGRPAVKALPKLPAKPAPTENVRSALNFLTAVRDAGTRGLSAEGVRDALGVAHVKAIGTKASVVNKMLAEFALRRNSVYTNDRTANGRLWKPGKNVNIALEELQKRSAAH